MHCFCSLCAQVQLHALRAGSPEQLLARRSGSQDDLGAELAASSRAVIQYVSCFPHFGPADSYIFHDLAGSMMTDGGWSSLKGQQIA